MEKAIYKVKSARYGRNGFYDFINERYEEEFSNFEDAKDVYDNCIEMAKNSDNYDYLRGDYPYDCISLSKDGEIIERIDYEISESQYRDMPEISEDEDEGLEWTDEILESLYQQSLEEHEEWANSIK